MTRPNFNIYSDDLTNNSILEFLNQKQQWLDADSTVLDVDSIFEEINRLSDTSDDRSVDVILREAEQLLSTQTFENFNKNVNKQHSKCGNNNNESNDAENLIKSQGNMNFGGVTPPKIQKKNRIMTDKSDVAEYEMEENSIIQTEIFRTSDIKDDNLVNNAIYDSHHIDEIPVKNTKIPNQSISEVIFKMTSDKSTSLSPTRFPSSSNCNLYQWQRQRTLEEEFVQLQDKLKDAEERLESRRIKHDSLSQLHRLLKENYINIQEETDRLKLEIQHLSECSNILRSELQNARCDRNESFEVQKLLKTELSETRSEKKKLLEKSDKDTKLIQDLQRQCREMERILLRKHPDSVSALIVASRNTANPQDDLSGRHLLEQRITQLETDAKEQDAKAQIILAEVQAKFSTVQSKYETHIADLETQVLSLQEINSKLNEKLTVRIEEIERYKQRSNLRSTFSQTDVVAETAPIPINVNHIGLQTNMKPLTTTTKSATIINNKMNNRTSAKMKNFCADTTICQNSSAKEDAHLLATIRGMRVDLAIKEKAIQRLSREVDECKKIIKKLQKDRDGFLKFDRASLTSAGSSTISGIKKMYEPTQYTDGGIDQGALKERQNKMKLLEIDYKALHDKRLHDVRTK